jgi:hypothetical protein
LAQVVDVACFRDILGSQPSALLEGVALLAGPVQRLIAADRTRPDGDGQFRVAQEGVEEWG